MGDGPKDESRAERDEERELEGHRRLGGMAEIIPAVADGLDSAAELARRRARIAGAMVEAAQSRGLLRLSIGSRDGSRDAEVLLSSSSRSRRRELGG